MPRDDGIVFDLFFNYYDVLKETKTRKIKSVEGKKNFNESLMDLRTPRGTIYIDLMNLTGFVL